ncbi:MAG: MBL fold metallo-hydrolase, partial [Anaerotignum sp.]|nr:MBL fold metallo-hydrolase [Anaerotignum sp.]
LAIEATKVFVANYMDCYDTAAMELVRQGINPLEFSGLTVAVTADDSMAINFDKNPKIIISASGMCEAGRIRHHLKHNLWRPESTILFVGYQSVGTLGRALIDGEPEVKLFGETITVSANIQTLAGVSGHADKKGLLNWVNHFEQKPERVFVVHGEDMVCDDFVKCLHEEYGYEAFAPYSGACFDLINNQMISEGVKIPVKPKAYPKAKAQTEGGKRAMYLADQLDEAAKRLQRIVNQNKGGANRDMEKLLKEINALCDKLES